MCSYIVLAFYSAHMKTLLLVAIAAFSGQVEGSMMGMGLSMMTSVMPPELRGLTGTLANVAMAQANKKKGLIEVIQDGSDYGWICLCGSKAQLAALKKQGKTVSAQKCPDDQEMGCRPPQVAI